MRLLFSLSSVYNAKVTIKQFTYGGNDVVSANASWFGTGTSEVENVTFDNYFRLAIVGVQPDNSSNQSIHEDTSVTVY